MQNVVWMFYSDLLECDDDNGGCEQTCTDFLGGYNCSCWDGFHPLTENASSCAGMYDSHFRPHNRLAKL